MDGQPLIVITGAMAAGKSATAQAVAERLPRSVHVRGDVFRRMIVRGRVDMNASPSPEAFEQLRLRYRVAAAANQSYLEAGFSVVYQDVIIGPLLDEVIELHRHLPLHVVVLNPPARVIAAREAERAKTGYGAIPVAALLEALAETPRKGLWLDNGALDVDQTADAVLANLDRARIGAVSSS